MTNDDFKRILWRKDRQDIHSHSHILKFANSDLYLLYSFFINFFLSLLLQKTKNEHFTVLKFKHIILWEFSTKLLITCVIMEGFSSASRCFVLFTTDCFVEFPSVLVLLKENKSHAQFSTPNSKWQRHKKIRYCEAQARVKQGWARDGP